MSMKHSQIFKQNLQITFTYQDKSQNQYNKKNQVFQSLIFTKNQTYRQPLAEATNSNKINSNLRFNRTLAQSMYGQNSLNHMNQSFCFNNFSVGQQTQTGNSLLIKFNPKQIKEQIYQTKLQDFEVGQLLGKGATSNVYVCRHRQTGFFFALKKIKKKAIVDQIQFTQSIKIHLTLNQPNIAKLYTVFHDKEHIYFLMELCMDGNLKQQAKNIKSPKQIKGYVLGMAYGLRHLHKRGIRHGDLKLQNVMCSYGMPKIVDFDCISLERNKSCYTSRAQRHLRGSPLYFSPQMMRESVLRLHDDVWSLGIIFYQLTCGCYPFEVGHLTCLQKILRQQIKPFPSGTDCSLEFLIRKMLSKRLCERPRLSQIIKQLERS